MMHKKALFILWLSTLFFNLKSFALPEGFVYLRDIDPSIIQEMRYATDHNFVGRPIKGYNQASQCILTKSAALQLAQVQAELKRSGLSLKIYDCYRPKMAVADFMQWSKDPKQQQMKAEFYPQVDKADFFKLGYVAEKSGHTRGSTADLTIIPDPAPKQIEYHSGDRLVSCIAPYLARFRDNSIDMGSGFDCMDPLSHAFNENVSRIAYQHRLLLRNLMMHYGFEPYVEEWWHFTLKNEPYPQTYFDFPVA